MATESDLAMSVSMVFEVFEGSVRLTARYPRGESRYDPGEILLRFQACDACGVITQFADAHSTGQLELAYEREEQRLLAITEAAKETPAP